MRAASGCLWPAQSPALFPAYAAQHSVGFDPTAPLEPSRDFPGIALPDWFDGAARKRQMEYLAGRHCAREALRQLVPELASTPIATGSYREPLWPPGMVGAITHTADYASAVVARSSDATGIGLDAEVIMPPDEPARLRDQLAVPDELESLARSTTWPMPVVLTVVFSAKESLFKCLYPLVGRYFDFRDAVIDEIDPAAGRFTIRLVSELAAGLPAGHELRGRLARDGDTITTAIVRPA